MSDAIKRVAASIAPEMDRLFRDWVSSDMIPGSAEYRRLEQFLWDNKVGILRVLEAQANGQQVTK